jgi:uncharacterized protein YbbK (DUF523 family)
VLEKVLISSCLVGYKVRYNGSCLSLSKSVLDNLASQAELVAFCPEVAAGLSTPRASAEIINGKGIDVIHDLAHVVGNDGINVTKQFLLGAEKALEICHEHAIKYALLTDGSPSCGSSKIYDGTFSGATVEGSGVTAALLERAGIKVFSQHTIRNLQAELEIG